MASTQNSYAAAWVFDIYQTGGSGTVRAATRDIDDDAAVTALGAFYPGLCLSPDMMIATDEGGGFAVPSLISGVRFQARGRDPGGSIATYFDASLTWHEVRVRIRHWNATTAAATVEFNGVIVDADFKNRVVIFSFADQSLNVLDLPVPTYTVRAEEFASATDVGSAIPVPFGNEAIVRPPYIATDLTADATDPGGHDYAIGWRKSRILGLYADADTYQVALELLTTWADAPGTPTYASATTFTVSDDKSHVYVAGVMIRFKTTASGSAYVYARVTGYSAGTVTVNPGGLDSGLTSVELSDYLSEFGRYNVSATDLASVRLPAAIAGGLLARVKDAGGTSDAAVTNPMSVAEAVLSNTVWGASQSVNAASFSTAATAYSTAGLGSAFEGALGWDGRQVRLGDFLSEVASWRGALFSINASGEWIVTADTAPSAATLTFGYGDSVYENVFEVLEGGFIPYGERVTSMELRYAPGGRRNGNAFTTKDYTYAIAKTVFTTGRKRIMTSDYLRSHTPAKIVLDYRAKQLIYGDRRPVIRVGQEARDVTLRQLVHYTNTPDGIDADFQVRRIEKRLDSVVLFLRAYDAAMYTDTSGDITTPTTIDQDETTPTSGSGVNRLLNPDFSTKVRQANAPVGTADYLSLPGVYIQDTGADLTVLTVTADFACIGSHRLSIVATGTEAALAAAVPRLTWVNTFENPGSTASGFACLPAQKFYASIYADTSSGWRFRVTWLNSSGVFIEAHNPHLRTNAADSNGKGWFRYWSDVRAPATAAYCYLELVFVTADTYQFDAAQLELAATGQVLPSVWKRNVQFSVNPQQLDTGDLTVRARNSDREHGTRTGHRYTGTIDLTGATVASPVELLPDDTDPLIPAGATVDFMTGRILDDITFSGGGSSIQIGRSGDLDSMMKTNALGAMTAGTQITSADNAFDNFKNRGAAMRIYCAPDAGAITAGEIEVTLHLKEAVAPTV